MTKLSACGVEARVYLAVDYDTAANARAESYHNAVARSLCRTRYRLAECRNVCVVCYPYSLHARSVTQKVCDMEVLEGEIIRIFNDTRSGVGNTGRGNTYTCHLGYLYPCVGAYVEAELCYVIDYRLGGAFSSRGKTFLYLYFVAFVNKSHGDIRSAEVNSYFIHRHNSFMISFLRRCIPLRTRSSGFQIRCDRVAYARRAISYRRAQSRYVP